jgi:hypothetical protein
MAQGQIFPLPPPCGLADAAREGQLMEPATDSFLA